MRDDRPDQRKQPESESQSGLSPDRHREFLIVWGKTKTELRTLLEHGGSGPGSLGVTILTLILILILINDPEQIKSTLCFYTSDSKS